MKMKTFRGTETVLAKYIDVLAVNCVVIGTDICKDWVYLETERFRTFSFSYAFY